MWFVPFMAVTSFIYSVLLLIKQRNIKVYYLFVMICAFMGTYLVMKKGVGGYYKWLALLMIPIMAAGNEYRKFESKIVEKEIPLILVGAVMLFLCKQGEIELSKGMIFGFLFYPITLLGILFCIKLKDYVMRTKKLSNWLVWVGSNSMYVMGYHFIVFKLIDIIMSVFTVTTPKQLKLFPYSFLQCRALYIFLGVLLPCAVQCMLDKGKNYTRILTDNG